MTESTSEGGKPKPTVESGRSGRLGRLNNLLNKLDPFSVDNTLKREDQDTERRKARVIDFLNNELLGQVTQDIEGVPIWPLRFKPPYDLEGLNVREEVLDYSRKVSLTVRTDETDPDKTLGQVILRYPSDEKGNLDPQAGLEMELSFTRLKNHDWDSLDAKLPLSKKSFTERETILLWEKWQKSVKNFMDRKIKVARERREIEQKVEHNSR